MAAQSTTSRKLFTRPRSRSRRRSISRSRDRSLSPRPIASAPTLETSEDPIDFLINHTGATIGQAEPLDPESFAGLLLQSVPLLTPNLSRDEAKNQVKKTGQAMIRQTSAGDPFAATSYQRDGGFVHHSILFWNGEKWSETNSPPRASAINVAANSEKARDALVPYLRCIGNWPIHCTGQPGEICQPSFPFHIWQMAPRTQSRIRLQAEINSILIGVPRPLTNLINQYLM
jgi:hypothetical protein